MASGLNYILRMKIARECRGPAGLTCVTDPLCNPQLRTDQLCRRLRNRIRRAIIRRRPRLGGDRKGCQQHCHDTGDMRSAAHRVGK